MLLLLNVGIFTMVDAELQERADCRTMVEYAKDHCLKS